MLCKYSVHTVLVDMVAAIVHFILLIVVLYSILPILVIFCHMSIYEINKNY